MKKHFEKINNMQNALLAVAITLIIFGGIGVLVMALMVKPLLAGGIIVFVTMVILYMLIYKILKNDNNANCEDF
jgi:ABC-type bacteriocin/lantibiotic exporter with double-glycine peptidase domain